MPQSLNDKQLIELVRSGDAKAFRVLFDRYWQSLLAMALYRLQSRDLAQDVLQELFVDLWEKRDFLMIRTSVKGYLNTALKNRILNKIKSESVRDKYENMIVEYYRVNNLATGSLFSEKILIEEVRKETAKLPVRCREVFELSRLNQMTHKEIGEQLNISPKTVENHIGNALKILRPKLKQIISLLFILLG